MLHDPLLPVRHPQAGVVLAGLDQVARADGEAIVPVSSAAVVDLAACHALVANTRVHGARLVVRGPRHSFVVLPLLGDVLSQLIAARMEAHKPKFCELVEDRAGIPAVAHLQRDLGIGGIGETVNFGHVERAPSELRGHVEHPAAPDGCELRTIPNQRDRRTCLGADGQQGDCGVLVEHPRLVNDDPLAVCEPRAFGWAAIGVAGLGVSVARREARPYAVTIPPPPVRMHERRNARSRHPEFVARHQCGTLRRRNHPRRPTLLGRDFDYNAEHRCLPCARCSLNDHQRVGGCDGSGGALLPRIKTPRLGRCAHVSGFRLAVWHSCGDQVAQFRLGLHHAQAREVRHMLRRRRTWREYREAVFEREACCSGDEVAQLLAGCAHPGLGDDLGCMLLHRMAIPRRCASRATIQGARGDPLHR